MKICEHKKEIVLKSANGTPYLRKIVPCTNKAKYIVPYSTGDKLACGIHAQAWNKRATRHGWEVARAL